MPLKNSAVTVCYVAWDSSANVGKTGDAANHTPRAVGDGTEFTPAATPVEVDAVNLKGIYKIALAAGENNYDFVTLGGKSTTPNVNIMPISWTNTVSATVVSYPGTTPQTGDSFARIGASGAGLTALGDTRLANLDVTVSSRLATSAYAPAPSAGTIATAVLTTQMTESYSADGVPPTLTQGVLMCMQRLTDFFLSGTALNVRKLDGSTTAYGLTLDSATAPTSSTRTS